VTRYKQGIFKSSKAGTCKYRSSWELAYMQWLDTNKTVISYSYEKTVIPYVSNKRTGRLRKYLPDFLVYYNDRIELVEIKPKVKLKQVKVKKKLEAAKVWCLNNKIKFVIVTETELKALNLI
jgi:hypothetical protein